MNFSDDEEILQDFLVEAGEILELLSEQLVSLERSPEDTDLLNAIFRGFHTVKGGAGFLQLNPLVDCCHLTENLFDLLRNGQRKVTPDLMDTVLHALDAVNTMFQQVRTREELTPANTELMRRLAHYADPSSEGELPAETEDSTSFETSAQQQPAADNIQSEDSDEIVSDISDDEFEHLLSALDEDDIPVESNQTIEIKPSAEEESKDSRDNQQAVDDDLFIDLSEDNVNENTDEITEDEFEALLDQLHGKGGDSGADASKKDANPKEMEKSKPPKPAAAQTQSTDTPISDKASDSNKSTVGTAAEVSDIATAETESISSASANSEGTDSEATNSEEISDSEFEALLDELHGEGQHMGVVANPKVADKHLELTSNTANPTATAKPHVPAPAKTDTADAKQGQRTTVRKAAQAASNTIKQQRDVTSPVPTETTVRVDTRRLDDIMNMVGELVLVRNRLVRLGLKSDDESISKAVSNLDVVTADLQTSVMKTRMQPIKKVFGRFPRVVRDLARSLKKEITLELQGEETDLDKNLVEALADPLVHLVRNSVDHGIELPAEREAAGKSRIGTITLSAEQEGDHILLSITDDGNGMDPKKLRHQAIEKGLLEADVADRLNDAESFDLIFSPGFSTKAEISDISGRGVGMDVVKTKITQLNGSIQINSIRGKGSRIEIKVPLTLAIMPTLMVMVGEQTFALPLVSVNEIFHMDLTKTNVVDGQQVITVRDKALPLFHLKHWLVKGGAYTQQDDSAHVVIVSVGTQRVGFVVDQLIGQEEVVIKPLGKMLHGTPGMAGATITGDGRIALILDVPSMLKFYVH